MSAHQLMGGRTRVHAGVMQNEILDLHELSRPPQRRAGVVEMGTQPEGFRDRAHAQTLIQARQRVGRRLQMSVLINSFNKLERNYFFSFARYSGRSFA
jgi:hypothetical protein